MASPSGHEQGSWSSKGIFGGPTRPKEADGFGGDEDDEATKELEAELVTAEEAPADEYTRADEEEGAADEEEDVADEGAEEAAKDGTEGDAATERDDGASDAAELNESEELWATMSGKRAREYRRMSAAR